MELRTKLGRIDLSLSSDSWSEEGPLFFLMYGQGELSSSVSLGIGWRLVVIYLTEQINSDIFFGLNLIVRSHK